jgi:hypothetical protein
LLAFCRSLPALALLALGRLGSLGTVDVVWVHLLVLLLLLFREIFPPLPFFLREALPLLTDHLRQIRLALLLDWCHRSILSVLGTLDGVALLAALPPEQDEGVLGTFDVILFSLPGPSLYGITTERLSSLWQC